MELLLVPLIGPFHLRSPAYNSVTVRDLVAAWQPEAVATTALTPGELGDPAWQDTPEMALPLAVVPWARRKGLVVHAVGEPHPDPSAEEDFRRYLEPYPEPMKQLRQLDSQLQPLGELLQSGLTLERIRGELLPALEGYQLDREERFGDGPASGWLRERMEASASRARELGHERVALLTPADHLPMLQEALLNRSTSLADPPSFAPSPEARERAILDYAFQVEVPEPGQLIGQLREVAGSEARFHEANLLLAGGHGYEALEVLEKASQGDFSLPYFLPGYLLARLGQLRDLADRRQDALRAYRGVLALDFAPAEAVEAAREGLEKPFEP